MTTTLDIIDTAVKIGFGAAISGISAYFLSARNHSDSLKKHDIEKRQELAKDIALRFENLETLFNEFIINFHDKEINSAKKILADATNEAHTVRAMANLISSDELVEELEKSTKILEEIYQELLMNRPESPKIDLLGKEIAAIKRSAYPLIRKIYNETRT